MGITFERIKSGVAWRVKKCLTLLRISPLLLRRLPESFDSFSRDKIYDIFLAQFYSLPTQIRKHRQYFIRNRRGFGEDAFHAAWFYVFTEYSPSKCLEVGVYRGQTLSLWTLIARHMSYEIEVVGISPMTSAGDSVSTYVNLDYRADILNNFDKFHLTHPKLIQELSQNAGAKEVIENNIWDLIYIDGSHEFEICLSDVLSAEKGLKIGGLLVIDDSSLYSDFSRSFKGHPGPSKVVEDFLPVNLEKILSVGHNNFFCKVK